MNIPRAFSDPGPSRLTEVHSHALPHIPSKLYVQQTQTFAHPGPSASGLPAFTQVIYTGTERIPHPTSRSARGSDPSIDSQSKSPRKRRSWIMKILCAPSDFVKWVIKKWFAPSDECMRCVNITYWLVLIVGGMVSAVVALS
jgi:hypothetical protein